MLTDQLLYWVDYKYVDRMDAKIYLLLTLIMADEVIYLTSVLIT